MTEWCTTAAGGNSVLATTTGAAITVSSGTTIGGIRLGHSDSRPAGEYDRQDGRLVHRNRRPRCPHDRYIAACGRHVYGNLLVAGMQIDFPAMRFCRNHDIAQNVHCLSRAPRHRIEMARYRNPGNARISDRGREFRIVGRTQAELARRLTDEACVAGDAFAHLRGGIARAEQRSAAEFRDDRRFREHRRSSEHHQNRDENKAC